MKKISTLLFIYGLLISTVSTAQFALREDFLYPPGPLVNAFNPFWKTISGTTGQIMVSAPGLTYTGYKTASAFTNKISIVAGNSEDVTGFVDISQDGVVDANDTIALSLIPNLYYSFLIRLDSLSGLTENSGSGDYFSGIVPANNSTFYTSRVYIRRGSTDGYQVGLKINSHASNATAWAAGVGDNMVVGATYLLVFRYTSNPGTKDDMADMWVNPVLSAGTIPTPLVTVTNNDASTSTDITKLGGVLFRQGTSTPSAAIDAIAAGVSWDDVILPVGLQSFNAALQNNQAKLNWEIATSQDLKGFYVERSVDGRGFETIGYIAGNSSSMYSFTDVNIQAGINYYRLRMIGIDGSFKYSSVVVINNQQFSKTTLFPNPVRSNLTIAHDLLGANAVVRIFDMSGKQVFLSNLQSGATQSALSLPTLSKGAYTLVLENNGARSINRFVKD